MTDNRSDEPDSNDDYVEPDLPPEPEDAADDGGPALSPEELDIADSEYVEPLDDSGRYVVSPGGGPPNVPDAEPDGRNPSESRHNPGGRPNAAASDKRRGATGGVRSPETARTLLAEELQRSNARYGIDVVARFDGETARHRTASDDVVATFENLVRWYARHVSDGTPAEEVIEILLREANFVGSETPNLAELLETHDLDGSDTIDDLVAAIREESDRS